MTKQRIGPETPKQPRPNDLSGMHTCPAPDRETILSSKKTLEVKKLMNGDARGCYWAGTAPPTSEISAQSFLLSRDLCFRELPSNHGNFHTVCFVEHDLSGFTAWQSILDEMIRLLHYGKRCRMVVRLSSSHVNLAEFASFLERRTDCVFHLEHREADLFWLTCEKRFSQPSLGEIGFGVITDGRRLAHVSHFIESVISLDGISNFSVEIAVCGPSSLEDVLSKYRNNDSQVSLKRLPDPKNFSNDGWITKKKNLLVDGLQAENLIILHDRYVVPHDFLRHLVEFGPDFDLIVPAQVKDGKRFPDWTAASSAWDSHQTYLLPYGEDSPFAYVNGGCLIAKRAVLANEGWSEILFWNQREDIELTRRLRSRAIVPRVAPKLVLEAIDARHGYELGFERTGPNGSPAGDRALPRNIAVNLSDRSLDELCRQGLIVWHGHWECGQTGIRSRCDRPELALNAVGSLFAKLHIAWSGNSNLIHKMSFTINGSCIAPEDITYAADAAIIDLRNARKAAGGQLTFSFENAAGLTIKSIKILDNKSITDYPQSINNLNDASDKIIGDGWWPVEAWGAWSKDLNCHLVIPCPSDWDGERDLELTVTLQTLPDFRTSKLVGVHCNGFALTCLRVSGGGKPKGYKIRIPMEIASRNFLLQIRLSLTSNTMPPACNAERDTRPIGIGLKKVDLRQHPKPLQGLFLRDRSRR